MKEEFPLLVFGFHHRGRSFYSEERYAEALKEEDTTAAEAEDASLETPVEVEEEIRAPRAYRQEEARLVTYVKGKLEDLYESDYTPESGEYAFDVHANRKGAYVENVDLLAVHWRSRNICELITVEVKLGFTPYAVQQALNYTRFSHRVWIAVRVEDYSPLQAHYPTLFDYTISRGLGVLACKRMQGGRYDVSPVHWPLRNQIDPLEEE